MRSRSRASRAAWGRQLVGLAVVLAGCSSSPRDDAGMPHVDAGTKEVDASSHPDGPAKHDATGRGKDASKPSRDAARDREAPDAREAGDASDATADAPFTGLCLDCIENKCMPSGLACERDATCNLWLGCAMDCFSGGASASCLAACDAQFPSTSNLYGALYACVCTGCTEGCPTLNVCAHGPDGGP